MYLYAIWAFELGAYFGKDLEQTLNPDDPLGKFNWWIYQKLKKLTACDYGHGVLSTKSLREMGDICW